jgi:maltose O-acetyltransferase
MLRHLINIVLRWFPPSHLLHLRATLLRLGGLEIEPGVAYCGHGWVYGRGKLFIGRETWLSVGVVFHTHLDATISIGARCDIGPDVRFIVGSHKLGDSKRRAGKGVARPIRVGNGCWIGAGCFILDGVTIGDGCVIAAGAVVVDDIPPNTMAAGVPAVVKKSYA